MYKTMVIDDDEHIRTRVKDMIAGSGLDIEICCEASDGEDALELFRRHKPNIVITDINIPLISGLELAKRFLAEDKDTHVIVITGFGSLEGAQEAIKMGTADFILKPIRQAELVESLNRAITAQAERTEAIIKARRMETLLSESLPLLRERFLHELVSMHYEGSEEECIEQLNRLDVKTGGPAYVVAVLSPYYHAIPVGDRRVLQIALENITAELLEDKGLGSVFFFDAMARMVVLVQGDGGQVAEVAEQVLSTVRDKLRFYFSYDFTAGISGTNSLFSQAGRGYDQALEALEYVAVFGENNIASIGNIIGIERPRRIPVRGQIDEIIRVFRTAQADALGMAVKQFVGRLSAASMGSNGPVNRAMVELVVTLYSCADELGLTVAYDNDYSEILGSSNLLKTQERVLRICDSLMAQLEERRKGKAHRLVASAKEYIEENLADSSLNLTAVSQHVGLTSVYFSSLFKDVTGMNFVDYLNRVRIEQAKRMLGTTNLKIYEVAEAVGYANPKYFYQVFKKITGLRPKEFTDTQ